MKLLARNTDYAVRAIIFMARKDAVVSVGQLSTKLGVPHPFLRKILQLLHKQKILYARKGKGGGFKLAVKPERISLAKLIEIFSGKINLINCTLSTELCPDLKKCKLRKIMKSIEVQVLKELKNTRIVDLLK